MKLIDIVQAKRAYVERFANRSGAAGEVVALADMAHWVARPKGHGLKVLLAALRDAGVTIKGSSFDAISLPSEAMVDFSNAAEVAALGPRHRVALYNKLTGELQLTSVAEILARAKSLNWQLSVQL